MGKIHLLDELTANQIAAGEVIERPVSVVKELIENALDANASNIHVEIQEGGLKSIRVVDDGFGMSQEDMLISVKRHATSKLRSLEDLNTIVSLGFRGEALPSIVSVAKVEIISREPEAEYGHVITTENGLTMINPIGAPIGTSITVNDLFFNTPARKKFMKSSGYEAGLIHELLIHLSLSRPDVNFRFIHEKKEILNTHGIANIRDLLELFYSSDIKDHLISFSEDISQGKIEAYITLPTYHRANRKGINFIINNRRIVSKELMNAVKTSYENILPKGKFPVAVFVIQINPNIIDVNVHPSKLEVRFRKFDFIDEIAVLINKNLHQQKDIPHYKLKNIFKKDDSILKKPIPVQQTWHDFNSFDKQVALRDPINSYQHKEAKEHSIINMPSTIADNYLQKDNIPDNKSYDNTQFNKCNFIENLKIIGQLSTTFILAEGREGLYIIDQHVAHERVLFEKLLAEAESGHIVSQYLLTPVSVELTLLEEELLIKNILPISDLGIIIEHFGSRTYLIRAVPECVSTDPKDFLYTLLKNFEKKNTKLTPGDIRKDFIITASCKGAIKANQKLYLADMENLIEDLRKTKNPLTCPHGRPIIYKISYDEIKKTFGRL